MGVLFFLFFNSLIGLVSLSISGPNCTLLLDAFAESYSKFVHCAINNSRPITMCEGCATLYTDTLNNYKTMKQTKENNTVCLDKFINLDRLQIVQTLYNQMYDLWNTAKCYECFTNENDFIAPKKSNETIIFNERFHKYMSCIEQDDINDTTCETCMQDYSNLNDYYISISDENAKIGVCMDIVDTMNTTRSFWSEKCCKYRQHKEYVFIASTIAVLLLTIFFYVSTQCCSEKNTPTIIQQTRLAESLNHVNH